MNGSYLFLISSGSRPSCILYFLNSYALELSESSRNDEAAQVANVIAASPLISRYREWQEALSELESRRKRSSVISVAFSNCESRAIHDSRIKTVVESMEANVARKISLSELAEMVNLSASHFSHVFKSQTGYSPGDYLLHLRLEKASTLLRRSSVRIKEVMALAGFDTRSNFTHHFKKRFGSTPSTYRRRALKRR